MQVVTSISDLRLLLSSTEGSVGFVPTMGALHQGHISLITKAKSQNETVVCSIFVNPTQFNNADDLKKYPRTLDADVKMLIDAHCDILFAPTVEEMYPSGNDLLEIDLHTLDKVMEGKYRAGHFKGVVTIVKRLFDSVMPHKAYFGNKDFQQLAVIRYMVKQLALPIEIIGCPICREDNGLAMSSRNTRLTPQQRADAGIIFKILSDTKQGVRQYTPTTLVNNAIKAFERSPFKLEYFEIVNPQTLLPILSFDEKSGAIACVAVYAEDIRLIDNMELI